MEPLVLLGTRIRNRKLEWAREEGTQDKEIISLGDAASHYGAALADAMVFDMTSKNTHQFERSYGINKEFVREHRSCARLMEILDWYGSITDFTGSSSMDRSTFDAHFKDLKNPAVFHWETAKIEEYLSASIGGQTVYAKLYLTACSTQAELCCQEGEISSLLIYQGCWA